MEKCGVSAGQTDKCVVDRGITVRVEAHRLSDDVRTLDPSARKQTHFIHRIEQFSVRGLEAVDLGDRTRHDNAHYVGHIVLFYRFSYRLIGGGGGREHLNRFRFFLSCHVLPQKSMLNMFIFKVHRDKRRYAQPRG